MEPAKGVYGRQQAAQRGVVSCKGKADAPRVEGVDAQATPDDAAGLSRDGRNGGTAGWRHVQVEWADQQTERGLRCPDLASSSSLTQ